MVAIVGIHEEPRRAQHRRDAMLWKAVIPTDLTASKVMMAGEKVHAQSMASIEDHRQATLDIAQAVVGAQKHQGRGDAAAFKAGVANTSRHPSAEPDQPFLFGGRDVQDGLHYRRSAVAHPYKVGEGISVILPPWISIVLQVYFLIFHKMILSNLA